MTNVNIENAMAEVLEYLKGIRQEDIQKISPKFFNFLVENASKDYQPEIDYLKPLSELNLSSTSKAIICFICYKYWCESEEEKINFYKLLQENEQYYEKEWEERNKNMFKSKEKVEENNVNNEIASNLLIKKDNNNKRFWIRIKNFIKKIFKMKGE